MRRDIYSGRLKLNGKEHIETFRATSNYALSLLQLQRYQELKPLLRKTIPGARRVLGDSHDLTLRMRWFYGQVLCCSGPSLDDLREAVETLDDTDRTARRVLGGAHPLTGEIELSLQQARAVLRAHETLRPGNA